MIRTDRWICPHCDQLLSKKTFKAHKRRYFDASSSSWFTKQSLDLTGRGIVRSVLEQDNNLSGTESSNEDPPAPLPSPVTTDLADTAVLDTESPSPDFSLHQDTNPRTESHCGANSTSSGSTGIYCSL